MLMDMFLLLVVAATIGGARGDTMVSGTVFCDQCKDGEVSVLDYPLGGELVFFSLTLISQILTQNIYYI